MLKWMNKLFPINISMFETSKKQTAEFWIDKRSD